MKERRNKQSKSKTSPQPVNTSTRCSHVLPDIHVMNRVGYVLFFLLAWLWASWWMGDVLRIAYERSFVVADATLMYWLWQQPLGWLWIIGRALLTLYRLPAVGGLLVAALLTVGSGLLGYCLRLPQRWRLTQYLPAAIWMTWTASEGLNLFYMNEPGRILAVPFICVAVCVVAALIIWLLHRQQRPVLSTPAQPAPCSLFFVLLFLIFYPILFLLPALYLNHRHPYLRPLTRMQVQLLHNDYEGMIRTAHEHAEMSYRQMAGYYVIALAHTGQLADQLFDIKLEFDSLNTYGYHRQPNQCMNYHISDCNYHAGLIRAARHKIIEELTMDGPSLYTLKFMVKISLIEGDWALARKYLHILKKVPFEGDFISQYEPMVEHPELVQADPEFAAVIKMLPPRHSIEQLHMKPSFVGYYVDLRSFPNSEAQTWSTVACLYGKRMPDFLMRCQQFVGSMPPRSIAEGLIIQAQKNPAVLKAFPQLKLGMDRFDLFLQDAVPYIRTDRQQGAEALFEKYKGYYPYYYYFGNQRSTRKLEDETMHNKAGVN